jgi:hypothetical protein
VDPRHLWAAVRRSATAGHETLAVQGLSIERHIGPRSPQSPHVAARALPRSQFTTEFARQSWVHLGAAEPDAPRAGVMSLVVPGGVQVQANGSAAAVWNEVGWKLETQPLRWTWPTTFKR